MKEAKILLFTLYLSILASCGSISPLPPEIVVQESTTPDQPVSLIKIPIKVNLAPYFKATNKAVPKEFKGKEEQCEGVSYEYYFARFPIEFSGIGKAIKFGVDGKYWVKVNYCPDCTTLISNAGTCLIPRVYTTCGVGEEMPKMHISYKSEIGITNDYKLKSNTVLDKVKALSPCNMTIFQFNATSTLEKEITKAMKATEKDIDEEISSIDLKPEIESAWAAICTPIDLKDYGVMYMRPSRISLGDIVYKGDTAYFDAYLKAYPKIFSDTIKYTPKPLPNLSKQTDHEGFEIHMDIAAKYDSLSSILTKNITGTKIDVKGREIIFGNIEIYGALNNQLTIKVEFSGKKKGTIYLTGTPVFDAKTQRISFPDIEFDIKTKSALLKSAKWLFDKKVTDLIRESSVIDLKPYLDELKISLSSSLNGEINKGVILTGLIDDIMIDFILPKKDSLFIRIQSKGSLKIQM